MEIVTPTPKNYKYRIKNIPVNERANAPIEVRLLLFYAIKKFPIKPSLIEQARKKYPEYFEENKKTIIQKA